MGTRSQAKSVQTAPLPGEQLQLLQSSSKAPQWKPLW